MILVNIIKILGGAGNCIKKKIFGRYVLYVDGINIMKPIPYKIEELYYQF